LLLLLYTTVGVNFAENVCKYEYTHERLLFVMRCMSLYCMRTVSEDSFVGKAKTIKGLRKHARMRFGIIHYRYTHYFVRLREGRPPQHYYPPRPTGNEMLQEYLERLRKRRVFHSL